MKALWVLVCGVSLVACGAGGDEACASGERCFEEAASAELSQPLMMSCETKEAIFESNCGSGFQGCGDYVQDQNGQFHASCTCNGSTSISAVCDPIFT
jgi:hypothetical protein